MIENLIQEYAVIKTLDGNYRLGLPHAKSVLPIDTMTIKTLSVGTMVQVLGSTQEEVNKLLSQYL